MADDALVSRAPFAALAVAVGTGRGVVATDRDGLGLAVVAARKGQRPALSKCVLERFGITLPDGPYRGTAGRIAFAGTGEGIWLATQEMGGNVFTTVLEREIGSMAAVTDQSDGYAVLRLAGPRLRDTLAKIISIDLHSRAFKSGDVASTVASHMGVTLWRLDDDPDGSPVFEVAVFRSLAGSFWGALSQSAAEFGLAVAPSG